MRKFFGRMALILVPLALLMLNYLRYEKSGGDLNRIGKVSVPREYRDRFRGTYPEERLYLDYPGAEAEGMGPFDVLTVGDSFSQQGLSGYQNILAAESSLRVVNLDGYAYRLDNPLKLLDSVSRGNFFDILRPRFVVLEIIERRISWYGQNLNPVDAVDFADFESRYRREASLAESAAPNITLDYFSDIAKFFVFNLLYRFDSRAFVSQVYNLELTADLFSVYPRRLLFFDEDIANVRFGEYGYVRDLNDELNQIADRLAERGVLLIVMPTPDKSDLYGEFIKNDRLPRERFFASLEALEKRYAYLNAKALLLPHLRAGEKDIYFADDTHWSPLGARIAAEALRDLIEGKGKAPE